MITPKECKKLAQQKRGENRRFFDQLRQRRPRDIDYRVLDIHNSVFGDADCIACANCCRTLGPRIIRRDIERLAKFLALTPAAFVERYLRIDEDGDYVFKTMPCPFLQSDNYCSVYDFRPDACRDYPHTDHRNFLQILPETLLNIEYCPAVFEIVERLKKEYRL